MKIYCDTSIKGDKIGLGIFSSEGSTGESVTVDIATGNAISEIWAIVLAVEIADRNDVIISDNLNAVETINAGYYRKIYKKMKEENISVIWRDRKVLHNADRIAKEQSGGTE